MPDGLEAAFLHDRISHAEEIATDLWSGVFRLEQVRTQAYHSLNVAVLAISSTRLPTIDAEALIDFASARTSTASFEEFVRETDVRQGLRRLVADAVAFSRESDLRHLHELIQTLLLFPIGSPLALAPAERESVVGCAARIVSDSLRNSGLHPAAGEVPPRVAIQAARSIERSSSTGVAGEGGELSAIDSAELAHAARQMGRRWAVLDQIFYAIAGQILIPVPVLGALIGWFASGWLPGPGDIIGPLLLKRRVRSAVEKDHCR